MEYDKKIVNRLKRSDGQLHGVLNMMEEGKDWVAHAKYSSFFKF